MSAPIVSRENGDIIDCSDHNDIISYIEDGSYRVNTLSLEIQGDEVISSSKDFKPNKVIIPAGGLSFYDSSGLIEIAKLDESGNFYILGGQGQL